MSASAWMLGACGMGVGPLAIYLKGEGLGRLWLG